MPQCYLHEIKVTFRVILDKTQHIYRSKNFNESVATTCPRSLFVAQIFVLLASDMIYISVTPKLQEHSSASLQL